MVYEALRSVLGDGATAPQVIEYLTDNTLVQVLGLMQVVVPVVIGFIAFRKGYKFLKGALRSA